MLQDILGVSHKVVPALFAYLFYRIDQRAFLKYIKDKGYIDSKEEGVRIKDAARMSGYVMKNCKLYAWACWTAREMDCRMPKPEAFGVDPKDSRILRRLNLKHLEPRRGYERFKCYSLKTFDNLCQQMLEAPELRNYIGKFVSKKMSFLIQSYGETRHDLETSMKEAALRAWYKQYPRFDSELHMVNVAKANIHNAGQSLITLLTSKGRQRLIRNPDGTFEALSVDIAVLADVAAPPRYGEELQDHLQALQAVQHKLNDRAKEFLHCAAGLYHEAFSEYLKVSNDDAADQWPYHRYMTQAQKFFGVTPEKVERLFRGIRTHTYSQQ